MHGTIHLFERLPQVDDAPEARPRDWASAAVRSKALVGLIRNRRSYRNESRAWRDEEQEGVIVACPQKRSELPAILADFAARQVDYIAIDGGDGTVRDVLTCGAGSFGDSWPELIVLPAGKTNALAYDLGIPDGWTMDQAIAAAKRGNVVRRQPLVISQRDNDRAQVRGFVLGGGAFTRTIALGQKSHDLGAFNAAVVGLTVVWSVLQALFAGANNPWRRGTPMRLRECGGAELTHFGGLPNEERYLLFASTLERFPVNLDPFRNVDKALQVAVLDNPDRSLLLRLPSIFNGTASEATHMRGYHAFGTDGIEMDIGDKFILDGEAFPAGQYRLSAGSKLRFVVP